MPVLPPDHASAASSGARLLWQEKLRGAPVTVGFVLVFWAAGALSASLFSGPGPSLRPHVAATAHSLPGNWWAVLTCALWAQSLGGYLLGTSLVLAVGIPLERRMGSLKFAAAALASHVLGIGAALGFLAAARQTMGRLTQEMSGHLFLGPSALITGALMAGTALMPTLWRRRVRLVVFALLILLALYSGGFAHLVRLGAAVTGALLGPVLLGRLPRFGRPVSSRHEGRVLVALLVAVSAVGPVVAGLVPHAAGPLSVLRFLFTNIQPVDPQTLQSLCSDPGQARDCAAAQLQLRAGAGGIFMGILPSFLLLLLADGLRRGRRFAWAGAVLIQLALSLLAGITIAGVLLRAAPDTSAVEGIGAIEASGYAHPFSLMVPLLLPVALSILLLITRRLFLVAAPSGTYTRLASQVLAVGAALGAFYLLAGLALAGGFTPVPGPAELLADIPDRFLPLGYMLDVSPAFFPQSTAAVLLYEGIGVTFWAATALLVLNTFLRPARIQHNAGAARAREILRTRQGSSLSWMTTWPGNSYWFSPTGESFVAYRVIGGIALTMGVPVGPWPDSEDAFAEFTRFCTGEGWTPCFYSVPQDLRDHAASLGWRSVQVAQETVLPLDSMSFRGKKFQDIRTAMNNAAKAGIRAEWMTYATAPFSVLAQIQELSEEWVADKKMPEMGFTLGSLDELNDPDVRLLLAIDGQHRVHAVLSWLPVYRNGKIEGWTLDYMRRRSTGFRAGIEFLIASAALSFKDEGCQFVSLSGAPLARVNADSPHLPAPSDPQTAGGLDRLLDWLGATLEPVYGFRSLLAFKAKFQPRYEPLYMLYPDAASLPAIGNAVTRAYLPTIKFGESLALARRMFHRPKRPRAAGRRNPAQVLNTKHVDGA
ncbi:rhomboid family intramembrane serine protease [Pseudarthrobacter albicanus]|uniref:rhomboid family intramembrane serine protease n=1 Tax=Pseudarthrobacter albicanus TaxID=2823873 RepID=UPI001BA4E5EB|nr:rhomboid family intramembrane serine protease [Pseudarthrobacter albicanus]